MLKYLVTYRTKKGELKERLLDFPISREIGEVTNNGWIVLDIQVFHNGHFISLEEFEKSFGNTKNKIDKMKFKNIKKQNIENEIFHIKRDIKQFLDKL